MASKFICFFALIAAASAGIIDAPGHLAYSGHGAVAYSSAPSVSSVYSSVAAPAKTISLASPLAAVHGSPSYAAAVTKYSPSTAVSSQYLSFGVPQQQISYVSPVAKTISYAPAQVAYAAVPQQINQIGYAPSHVTYGAPTAIGTTHQNVVRSYDGTISQYSKAVDTAYSSVRKYDTRINNKVYSPAVYASHAAPTVYTSHVAPATATVYTSHAAPTVYASQHVSPVNTVYTSHAAPSLYASQSLYAAPTVYAAPAATYGSSYGGKTVSYSAGAPVAHVSFAGLGTQYAW